MRIFVVKKNSKTVGKFSLTISSFWTTQASHFVNQNVTNRIVLKLFHLESLLVAHRGL